MQLENQIGPGEQILWTGTKNKKVSFFEAIFNAMLPFALLWGLFDMMFVGAFVQADQMGDTGRRMTSFAVPFFLLHLMPVWIYLGGILTSVRRAQNTHYCVTDQAVYIQSGLFDTKVERKEYSHFTALTVGQSFWDKRADTGDVRITLDEIYYSGKHHTRHNRTFNIENIPDYEEVFRIVQQCQTASAARQIQPYMNPQQPQYGSPQVPQYGSPQVPQYGSPQVPQYGSPQAPQYNTPQAPAEMPELVTPPPDDFVDPTLEAFQSLEQDPFSSDR